MLNSAEASEHGREPFEAITPRLVSSRKRASTTIRDPRAIAVNRCRSTLRTAPFEEPKPHLIAYETSSHGRELIWERDSVLDTFIDQANPSQPSHRGTENWKLEQEELAGWFAEHGDQIPETITLWPHVKVHKQSFLRSMQERLQLARQNPDNSASDLWRLLRRVQIVLTAERCVKSLP